MHRKFFTLLCWVLFATGANAEILRLGLDGSQERDIRSISITEFAPRVRTVTLTKPEEVQALVHQTENWNVSVPRHWKRDFLNMVPVRYSVTVQRAASAYTLYLAVESYQRQRSEGQPFEPCIRFVLFSLESDGSFTTYLEGVDRSLNAGDTLFEQYLARLFSSA